MSPSNSQHNRQRLKWSLVKRYDRKRKKENKLTAMFVPFLSSFMFVFVCFAYILLSKQSRKVNINKTVSHIFFFCRISFVINAPPVFSWTPYSLDKRCEVMEVITMTYGCTKTYFYMSEIFLKMAFFVYSSDSIILFIIIVTMFHKLYIFS